MFVCAGHQSGLLFTGDPVPKLYQVDVCHSAEFIQRQSIVQNVQCTSSSAANLQRDLASGHICGPLSISVSVKS